jgi:hypothetical protein
MNRVVGRIGRISGASWTMNAEIVQSKPPIGMLCNVATRP